MADIELSPVPSRQGIYVDHPVQNKAFLDTTEDAVEVIQFVHDPIEMVLDSKSFGRFNKIIFKERINSVPRFLAEIDAIVATGVINASHDQVEALKNLIKAKMEGSSEYSIRLLEFQVRELQAKMREKDVAEHEEKIVIGWDNIINVSFGMTIFIGSLLVAISEQRKEEPDGLALAGLYLLAFGSLIVFVVLGTHVYLKKKAAMTYLSNKDAFFYTFFPNQEEEDQWKKQLIRKESGSALKAPAAQHARFSSPKGAHMRVAAKSQRAQLYI